MAEAALAEIGHNRPPEPTPYEAIKLHLDDLLMEARNWADGAGVETQAQADEISRLIEDLRQGLQAADAARVAEQEPFKVKLDEIQTRFNAYIAPVKNKVPGKVPVAIDALKATLKPYLDRLEAERRAREIEAKRIADEAAQKAAEAAKAALASDLGSQEEAAALEAQAHAAAQAATKAANDKAQARGGSRAMGLTRTYTPVLIDRKAALLHYCATQPVEITACLQRLAEIDVRAGKRAIPGFEVQEGTRL